MNPARATTPAEEALTDEAAFGLTAEVAAAAALEAAELIELSAELAADDAELAADDAADEAEAPADDAEVVDDVEDADEVPVVSTAEDPEEEAGSVAAPLLPHEVEPGWILMGLE